MISHIVIIGAAKTKNLLGLKTDKKPSDKKGVLEKTLLALSVAAALELVFLIAVGSAFFAIKAGVMSPESNLNLIYKLITK